jgi:hypothetical protein
MKVKAKSGDKNLPFTGYCMLHGGDVKGVFVFDR